MDWSKFFDLGGLNLWVVVSGNGLNLILEGMLILAVVLGGEQLGQMSQVILLLGTFLSTALVALICGRMERERYLAYAGYALPGNLILTVPSIVFGNPVIGLMLVAVAVMGAFNGARLAEMTVERHAR